MTTMNTFPADIFRAATGRTRRSAWPRRAWLCLCAVPLLIALIMLPGCGAAGFAAIATGGERAKAVFKLPQQPTLVLVDDPANMLGDRSLVNAVAARADFALVDQKALKQTIKPGAVNELRDRMGSDFDKTPVAKIGRELGAAQVIHVTIQDVTMGGDLSLLRPTAVFEVKVIDASANKRIFPVALPQDAGMTPVAELGQGAGFKKGVTMAYKPSGREGQSMVPELRRKLAERIGLEVAQIFYDHEPATMLIPSIE